MMIKIQLSNRMYSIEDIVRLLNKGAINLQPKYQRRRTPWPSNAKTSLIDTIVNNYPIPPIYLREFVSDSGKRVKEIIDGQQRISTINEFLLNQFSLSKNYFDKDHHNYFFKDLPFEVQQQILDFELFFMAIKGATEKDVISIFSRLNSFSLPVNPQEKRNSLYAGEFKTLAYSLANSYYTFWKTFKIFSDNQIARMRDAEFISELIVIIFEGLEKYQTSLINTYYKKFDMNFPEKEQIQQIIHNLFSIIGGLFDDNEIIKKQFSKSAWFFTLIIWLYERTYTKTGQKLTLKDKKIERNEMISRLESLVTDYVSGYLDPEITLLFQQGTNTTTKRVLRHKYFLGLLNNV